MPPDDRPAGPFTAPGSATGALMLRWRAVALLAVAILAISSSAVLVRWAELSPVALSFWRTAGGALVLAGPGLGAPAGRPRGRQRLLLVVAGTALGIHFATWLASLELTSVAASVTLVSSAPLLIALYLAVTGHRPSRRTWLAIGLALAGTILIAGGDASGGGSALAGDGLALAGAAMMAVYLTVGDRLRSSLSTPAYASRTYAVAAISLLPVVVVLDIPLWGYGTGTWLAVAGMIAGPQLAGHTSLNLLLKDLGSMTVSLALLAEPLCASVLVWLFFGELPPATAVIGAPLVIGGLFLQVTQRGPSPPRARVGVAS